MLAVTYLDGSQLKTASFTHKQLSEKSLDELIDIEIKKNKNG